jgi:hypothetical protein
MTSGKAYIIISFHVEKIQIDTQIYYVFRLLKD